MTLLRIPWIYLLQYITTETMATTGMFRGVAGVYKTLIQLCLEYILPFTVKSCDGEHQSAQD